MTRVVTNTTYHTFQSSIKMKLTNSGALRCYLIKLKITFIMALLVVHFNYNITIGN